MKSFNEFIVEKFGQEFIDANPMLVEDLREREGQIIDLATGAPFTVNESTNAPINRYGMPLSAEHIEELRNILPGSEGIDEDK